MKLSFSTYLPDTNVVVQGVIIPWIEEIEQRTNGRVKIELSTGGTLLKLPDSYRGVVTGVADISHAPHSSFPGVFPLNSIIGQPFLSPSSQTGTRILNELYQKFPAMKAEHGDVHVLAINTSVPLELHTSKKPVRRLEDIKGLKIGGMAVIHSVVTALGAVPVVMTPPEYYTSLDKGVIDGVSCPYGAALSWKLQELTKYHTNAHLCCQAGWYAMNKDKYNSLPPDIQKVIDDTSPLLSNFYVSVNTKEYMDCMKEWEKAGHEIIDLPPDETKRWREATRPVWDKWAADMEAKGLPGQAVLNEAIRLLDQYSK